jgi:hypothetical protein
MFSILDIKDSCCSRPACEPYLSWLVVGSFVNEERFCSGVAGGYQLVVVQAGSGASGRTKSALYLALPKRYPRQPLPCLIGSERYSLKIEVFHYSPEVGLQYDRPTQQFQ